MKVLEAGHTYALQSLDGGDWETLSFVKREGPGYPGNKGTHPGTIIQEVLRACIDRLDYVNNQIPCVENRYAKDALQTAIWCLERRAAGRHEREFRFPTAEIEKLPTCSGCGHIGCLEKNCHENVRRTVK
jgi:hypothetical protein